LKYRTPARGNGSPVAFDRMLLDNLLHVKSKAGGPKQKATWFCACVLNRIDLLVYHLESVARR
jgi:hypothetical protein